MIYYLQKFDEIYQRWKVIDKRFSEVGILKLARKYGYQFSRPTKEPFRFHGRKYRIQMEYINTENL